MIYYLLPLLQGVIQLRGSVALARSPKKFHQDQVYNHNEIVAQLCIFFIKIQSFL